MKIENFHKVPKQDLDDYTESEQNLLMLMGGLRKTYKTDYAGIEKAISVRLDCVNNPNVEAYAELSGLSKNLVINQFLQLAFNVFLENLSDEDYKLFMEMNSQKFSEWLKGLADENKVKENNSATN